MEARALGPVIGLGTSQTFGADVALAGRVVDATDEVGYRLYDTSPMYGSEEALGLALEPRRRESVLATKIWTRSVQEGRAQLEGAKEAFDPRVEFRELLVVCQRSHQRPLRAHHFDRTCELAIVDRRRAHSVTAR